MNMHKFDVQSGAFQQEFEWANKASTRQDAVSARISKVSQFAKHGDVQMRERHVRNGAFSLFWNMDFDLHEAKNTK